MLMQKSANQQPAGTISRRRFLATAGAVTTFMVLPLEVLGRAGQASPNGKRKRPALSRLMKPIITTRFPASLLWLHPDATVLCDREAAVDVPVRS